MSDTETSYIIVYGNLNDGFTFYGPYKSFDDADEASRYLDVHPTWIATVYRNVEELGK